MKPYPEGFPHFETEEEMYALIQKGLDDDDSGVEFGSEEWDRFLQELASMPGSRKLAS